MAAVSVMLYEKFPVEDLTRHDSLDLRAIGPKAWETIVASCTASELRLYYLKIRSLAGVERLRRTVSLKIEYANKVEDVSPLFAMHWLRSLTLFDLPRIRRIDGIEALGDLGAAHCESWEARNTGDRNYPAGGQGYLLHSRLVSQPSVFKAVRKRVRARPTCVFGEETQRTAQGANCFQPGTETRTLRQMRPEPSRIYGPPDANAL